MCRSSVRTKNNTYPPPQEQTSRLPLHDSTRLQHPIIRAAAAFFLFTRFFRNCFADLEIIATFAPTILKCEALQAEINRESGENPGQSRCCKFPIKQYRFTHQKATGNQLALLFKVRLHHHREGVKRWKQVRIPTSHAALLWFTWIWTEATDTKNDVVAAKKPTQFSFCMPHAAPWCALCAHLTLCRHANF